MINQIEGFMTKNQLIGLIFFSVVSFYFTGYSNNSVLRNNSIGENRMPDSNKYEVATFGEGCFWCTEAVFQRLKGVVKVESGYSGGTVPNPTYEAVCTGKTGHAEVCQITYDPSVVSFTELLYVFFKTHDPT